MFLPILCITPTHTREHGAYSTKKHLYYSEGTFWIGACRQYNVQPHLIGLRNRFCGFTEAVLISLNVWCELFREIYQSIKSAKAKGALPRCRLSQRQKLCNPTLAANRA